MSCIESASLNDGRKLRELITTIWLLYGGIFFPDGVQKLYYFSKGLANKNAFFKKLYFYSSLINYNKQLLYFFVSV